MPTGSDRLATLLTLLTLMAAPLLAGCVGTAQASAMDHQEQAHDRARAWDADAQLAEVTGVEGSGWPAAAAGAFAEAATGGGENPDYWSRASDDDEVGDGRCEFWVYAFVAPDKDDKLVVVTDAEGNVIHEAREPRQPDDHPLGEWTVDSDRAAQLAVEANDGLRRGTGSANYGILLQLVQDPQLEHPHWVVAGGGMDDQGMGGGYVILDAVTGDVIENRGGQQTR